MKYVPVGTLTVVGMLAAVGTTATLLASDGDTKFSKTQPLPISRRAPVATAENSFNLFTTEEPEAVAFVSDTVLANRRIPTALAAKTIFLDDEAETAPLIGLELARAKATTVSAVTSGFDWGRRNGDMRLGIENAKVANMVARSAVGSYSVASAGLASFPTNNDPYSMTNAVARENATDTSSLIDRFATTASAAAAQSGNQFSTAAATPVAAVPLPAGAPLLVLALGMIGLVRRKG